MNKRIDQAQNPSKTFTCLEMESALCIWECMTETYASKNPENIEWIKNMGQMWEDHGSVAMRFLAADLAKYANQIWELMNEGCDNTMVFDWEFIPEFVALVDWENGASTAKPEIMAGIIKAVFGLKTNKLKG